MKKYSACSIVAAVVLVAVAVLAWPGWSSSSEKDAGKGEAAPKVVRIPGKLWPGFKSAPEMDAVFRDLRPGQKVHLKLVFPKDPQVLSPSAIKISKGSVLIHTRSGYFRLSAGGKAYSSPDGKREIELHSVEPVETIEIFPHMVFDSGAMSVPWDDRHQPIRNEESAGQSIGYIMVELTADFQGQVSGWRVYHGY